MGLYRSFFSLALIELLLLSPAISQRSGRNPSTKKPKLLFGGFEPIGPGKGLRFPGEQRKKGKEQKATDEYVEYYEYPEDDANYPQADYYYYEDEEPLPSGPTREPPLPSGPTRRPGQATPAPFRAPNAPPVHPALNQFLNLPFLTTKAPRNLRKATRRPQKNLNLGQRLGDGPLRVHSSQDVLDQTAIFSSMDPHQEQFIAPPTLNAGALPLAFESDLPQNRFPPFLPRKKKNDE